MAINTLDHVTINTSNLDACKKFYGETLGFEDGPRPALDIPGAWMYCGDQPVLHIMAMPDAPTGPTGPLDHVAFRCTDFDEIKQRLNDAKLEFGENHIPDFKIRQLFLHDPDGVKIELNFAIE